MKQYNLIYFFKIEKKKNIIIQYKMYYKHYKNIKLDLNQV